jgi:hypothetical protein
MHYPRTAFSIDGSDTIIPTNPPTAQIGQRTALSAGDIAAANSLCPAKPIKEGTKDGLLDTRKERIKDLRLDTRKELVLDTRKERLKEVTKEIPKDVKEGPWDPIGPKRFDPVVTPGAVVRPTGALGALPRVPFAVAVPQRAPELADQGAADLEATAQEIDAALQAIADQLLELDVQRDALQAQFDELQGLLDAALEAHDATE